MRDVADPRGDWLAAVNALRAVPPAPWRAQVRRVAVILSSSRSGSSLLKTVLAQHPEVLALDGELEPLLALSGNGFGLDPACGSDALGPLANLDLLADNIFDGLTGASAQLAPPEELLARWSKRLLLQFPALFSAPQAWHALQQSLAAALPQICAHGAGIDQREAQRLLLDSVFAQSRWRLHYYDGGFGAGADAGRPFDEPCKIEEPPFVVPALWRRRCSPESLGSKLLLFKSPADAYRPGLYQQLFPQAEVRYLHLTRNVAASVNGLMDGWLSPTGFFAHDVLAAGVTLAIQGYSDRCAFGQRWWKFDLPPTWRQYTDAPLAEVCLHQWLSCQRHILASGVPTLQLAFEQLLADPAAALAPLWRWLRLPPLAPARALPVVMATAPPQPGRWRRRSATLLPMAARPLVRDTMAALGYPPSPECWP